MVVTLGQQYNVGEKTTVILYTYINRHAQPPIITQHTHCYSRPCTFSRTPGGAIFAKVGGVILRQLPHGTGKSLSYNIILKTISADVRSAKLISNSPGVLERHCASFVARLPIPANVTLPSCLWPPKIFPSLPSCLWPPKIFPSLPGSRLQTLVAMQVQHSYSYSYISSNNTLLVVFYLPT